MKTAITVKLSRPCIGAIVLRVLLVLPVLLTAFVLPTAAAPLRMATEAALISATNAALSAAKNYTDAAVADIPEVDMSAVTNIAQEAATAAQERAVADAADYTDRATNTLSAALSAADESLSSRLSLVSLAATNYTDAVAGQVRAEIPTDNAQLANGAGYVTAAITNGLQLTETDPTVPAWAKAASAPLPPDYVAVSNAAKSAATPQQLAAKQDKLPYPTNAIPQGAVSGLSTALAGKANDNAVVKLTGDQEIGGNKIFTGLVTILEEEPNYAWNKIHATLFEIGGDGISPQYVSLPSASGTLALKSDIPSISGKADKADVAAAALAATNYTDEVAGELSTSINQKYSKSSGDQLAQQVSAIGAHLNGEDARFVVTNYDSVVHTPEAYVEIKVSNNWLRVWDEGTRWNEYEVWKTNVDAELSYKADRAWGVYDSETGGYSPAGFTQVSSSNILIASGMAYQRTVTSAGAVWVLQCNQGVAQLGGDTNGYFKIMDSDGNSQFEVVKGDRREMGCDASGISLDTSTTPNNVIIPYSVVSEEHPTLYITERLETPNWKAETDADCIGTVTWTGSSGAYVATVHPKLAYPSMFIRATYMVGGETYIKNNAPVKMDSIILNGTKYYLGTAVINGHTVLTLSTTAP